MSLFSEIEKTIERGFHRFAERMFGPADSNELLLLHRAILAEVEAKVQIVARGRRVFPFASVVVTRLWMMRLQTKLASIAFRCVPVRPNLAVRLRWRMVGGGFGWISI